MKTRYILSALAALSLLAVGCVEEFPGDLAEIQLDNSYVSIPEAGGNGTVNVTCSQAWQIFTDENNVIPNWLTVSPMSGNGNGVLTFSAAGSVSYREATVKIKVGDKIQHVTVAQGVNAVAEATCAEVLAGPDGKTFIAEGVCTSIANTQYGNWYMDDGTGTVYIYGTVDGEGKYNWASFGIEEGDVVKVKGPKTTYNGTVELVDVKVINVTKSLVQLVSGASASLESDGGLFEVGLVSKGGNIAIEIPEAAKAWISISGIDVVPGVPDPAFPTLAVPDTTVVTFKAAENVAGPRLATISYSSSKDGNTSTVTSSVNQAGLSGTLAVPFTVEEAIAYALKLGGESTKDFYVKGIVSKIEPDKNGNPQVFGSYGNATFWISEDGVFNDDKSKDFEGYRVLWLNNQKWEEGNAQIAVGAEVLLCGKLTVYNGTAETSGNKAYVYQINGVTDEAEGIGTLDDPFTAVGGVNAAVAAPKSKVYVSGTVSKLVGSGFDAGYGNGSFWISKDGQYNDDKSKDFEAYQVNYLGGNKWTADDPQIAVGDKVVLYGPLTTYKGTSETQGKGAAYVYSLNGKTE